MAIGLIDVVVLVIYLSTVIGLGLLVRDKEGTLESYLLGGRNLPWWAILGSIVATETSTATVLSVPGEAFGPTGFRFLQLTFGYIVGRLIIVGVLLPLYFRGDLFTAYQILQDRFGTATRQACSALFLVTRNLGDGLRLFLAAIVLQKLANWSFEWSVIATGVVTIGYTFWGGMRSVVWNDCIQLVVYLVGGIAAVFVLADAIPGGWSEWMDYGTAHDKFALFNWQFILSDNTTFWAGLFGGAVLTLGTHGTDHMIVQRYLSARSQHDASVALGLSGVVVMFQFALFLFIGVGLACYYSRHPTITFAKADEVFTHFIVNVFPKNVGLIGLMLAAILAAAMSTLSSSLNSSASSLINDFWVPLTRADARDPRLVSITRWMTIAFGIAQMVIALYAKHLAGTVVSNALTIASFSAGIMLGVFFLGTSFRKPSQVAPLAGALCGLTVLIGVKFVLPTSSLNIVVAWPWLALIGSTTTYAVGAIVHLATKNHDR